MKKLIFLFLLLAGMSFGQTTVAPFLSSKIQLLDNSGVVCSGCLLDTFAAGTTTPLATYSESTGTSLNANPVVLDSAGRATVYLTSASYKFRLRSALGVTLWTQDVISWNTPLTTFAGLSDAGNFTQTQPTAATNVANQSSFSDCMNGTYWTGSVSGTDSWCLQDILGTGTNPTSTFTLTHSGSSGAASLSIVPNTNFLGNVTVQNLNNIFTVNSSTVGADVCAKIATGITAACTAQATTGGIVDARFFSGTQACASNPLVSATCPIVLELGNVTINTSAPWSITRSDMNVLGQGWQQTHLIYTGGASPFAFNVGTATPTVNQLFGVQLSNFQISGNASTTDVLFLTGDHHTIIDRMDLRNATGACIHTAFSVIPSLSHDYCSLNHGAFTTQPTNCWLFGQIDGSHQTTAASIIDPICEGVSGTGDKRAGSIQMVSLSGTSEQNTRGIETSLVANNNRQNVWIAPDLETGGGVIDDYLFNGQGDTMIAGFAFTRAHVGSTGINAQIVGGITNNLLIDAGATNTRVDGLMINNSGTGTCTDNGTDSTIRVINAATNFVIGCPWINRWIVPAFLVPATVTIDKQDSLITAFSVTAGTPVTLSNTVVTGAKPWRVIFRGEWVNNFEGGGLVQQAPYIEATSVAPSFLIGSQTLTVSLNGFNQFQVAATANTIGFSGRIEIMSHNAGAAGTSSILVKDAVSTAGQLISTVATGTAPLSVASTTNVANLNASSLGGATFASPGPIGSTSASTGKFTTITETNLLISNAAPTISAGFGTSPSIPNQNGTAAFAINVGTGGVATSGTIGLPTSTNGWNCFCFDSTTTSATVAQCKQTGGSTSTAVIANFNSTPAAAAWVASDIVQVSCFAR